MHSPGTGRPPTLVRFWDACFAPSLWLLSRFSRLEQSRWPIAWVIGLFLVQAVPATIIRASNLEEGRILAMARGAVEDGHWLTPFVYGERFVERTVLLSWITALFGELTGGVTLWSLRVPHLCVFLAGALLIYSLLRTTVGKSAAIFGAFSWITMPVVAPKFINSEPDIVLATLLFAAFFVWWRATNENIMTRARWLGVGVLLALAGLTKGPQPLAYFTLGVGAYILLKRRDQIWGFIFANALAGFVVGGWYVAIYQPGDMALWQEHSRLSDTTGWFQTSLDHLDFIKSLIVEFLPGTILFGPAVVVAFRFRRDSRCDLMLAAVLYSTLCTVVLIFWPGGVAARYAMPATLTVAVVGGLMFEAWRDSHLKTIASALFVTYLVFGGLLLRGWVAMPFWPHLFKESEIAGAAISSVTRTAPQPLYVVSGSTELNMLGYVKGKIETVTLQDLARLKARSVAVLLVEERQALARLAPELRIVDGPDLVSQKRPYRMVHIYPDGL